MVDNTSKIEAAWQRGLDPRTQAEKNAGVLPPSLQGRSAMTFNPQEDDLVARAWGLPRQNWNLVEAAQLRWAQNPSNIERRREDIARVKRESDDAS